MPPVTTNQPLPMARKAQRGVTLIEVLVSILIVAFGLLAMAAMQSNAVKYQRTSEVRSMATLLVNDLADRMRANRGGFTAGNYSRSHNPYVAPDAPPDNADCPANCANNAELAAMDMAQWLTTVFYALPGGEAQIIPNNANNSVDVWILWLDPSLVGDDGKATGDETTDEECPNIGTAYSRDNPRPRCMYFQVQL